VQGRLAGLGPFTLQIYAYSEEEDERTPLSVTYWGASGERAIDPYL
jgi:hypothetical protein